VDQLAQDYAGQPVVFLEYDVDNAPYSRVSRWWAAFDGGSTTLPMVMVDSGNQISSGYVDFYDEYKAMVDRALARPARAEVQAYWWRVGDKVGFYVQVTNLSDVTLSSSANSAAVHGIVYEDAHVGVTDRFVRAAVSTPIVSELGPNATGTYTMETSELIGVNWDRLHFVVLVDYRPLGSEGAYDMLQAAEAYRVDAPFGVRPEEVGLMVDPEGASESSVSLSLEGAGFVSWVVTGKESWINVTPSSGPITVRPVISVAAGDLAKGWQEGEVRFETADGLFGDQVVVKAYYGEVKRAYLPGIMRGSGD